MQIAAPRQGVLRAILLLLARAVAPTTLGPAPPGFLFPSSPALPCYCGIDSIDDSFGIWVSCSSVPAVSSSATWSSSGRQTSPLTIWEGDKSPAELGGGLRKKELGLCQPQAPPTPSCLCDSAHPLPPAGGLLSASPIHPPSLPRAPRGLSLLSSAAPCLFIDPSGACLPAREAEKLLAQGSQLAGVPTWFTLLIHATSWTLWAFELSPPIQMTCSSRLWMMSCSTGQAHSRCSVNAQRIAR